MSKTSTLANIYTEFSAENRSKTYKMIALKACQSQCSSTSRKKSSRLTGIRSIVRDKFPRLSDKQVIQAQDNISEWFSHHRNDVEFAIYRKELPFIFEEAVTIKQKELKVESPVISEVTTMEDCIQTIMSKSKAKIKWSQGDQTLEAEWSN